MYTFLEEETLIVSFFQVDGNIWFKLQNEKMFIEEFQFQFGEFEKWSSTFIRKESTISKVAVTHLHPTVAKSTLVQYYPDFKKSSTISRGASQDNALFIKS